MAVTEQQVSSCAASLLSYAEIVLNSVASERREALLGPARQQMLEYGRLDARARLGAKALKEVKAEILAEIEAGAEVDLANMDARVERRTEEKMASAGDMTGYDRYQELVRLEQSVREQEAAAGGAGGGDEELLVTDARTTYRDPWSQQEITEPYRNRRCGHIYDAGSLRRVLENKKKRAGACPYVGCTNQVPLSWDEVTEDLATLRAVKQRKESV